MLIAPSDHNWPLKVPNYHGAFAVITPRDHGGAYRYSTKLPGVAIKLKVHSLSQDFAAMLSPKVLRGSNVVDSIDDAIRRAYEAEEERPRLRDLPDGYRVSLIVSIRLGDLRARQRHHIQQTNEEGLAQRDFDHVADWLCRRDVTPVEKVVALKQIPSVRDALQRRKKHPRR